MFHHVSRVSARALCPSGSSTLPSAIKIATQLQLGCLLLQTGNAPQTRGGAWQLFGMFTVAGLGKTKRNCIRRNQPYQLVQAAANAPCAAPRHTNWAPMMILYTKATLAHNPR